MKSGRKNLLSRLINFTVDFCGKMNIGLNLISERGHQVTSVKNYFFSEIETIFVDFLLCRLRCLFAA